MRGIKLVLFIIIVSLVTAACQKTIDDDMTECSRLVVDGWIDSNGHPVVILTRSFSPMSLESTTFADLVVRWAEVTISDGEHEEVMIGRMDRSIQPPFIYTTSKIKGEPGRNYTITASYGDLKVSAQCEMPATVEIDNISLQPVDGSENMYEIKVTFIPVPGGCYQLCIYDPLVSGRPLPCFMGAYKASESIRGSVTLSASRPKIYITAEEYTPYYSSGTHIMVMLTSITSKVWNFWDQYDGLVAFGGNVFLAGTVNLSGNIMNGYGIWNARASSCADVIIL